jgi:hypothetical protein
MDYEDFIEEETGAEDKEILGYNMRRMFRGQSSL